MYVKLAAKGADAACDDNAERLGQALAEQLSYLDALERKYGERPCILLARANASDEPSIRLHSLLRAYELAEAAADFEKCTILSCAIADFYIEDERNTDAGGEWLATLDRHLADHPLAPETRDFLRLQELLTKLMRS